MAKLSNFSERDQLYTLVAGDRTDITHELTGAGTTRLKTDRTNRTIFIGLGGNGIKTINHIKGVVKKRLDEHWDEYIGFLGIDTDRTELDKAKHLTPLETLETTHPGVNDRYADRRNYPEAALRFMPKDPRKGNKTLTMPNMFRDGANQKRLVGCAKLHDHPTGMAALDTQVVQRLNSLITNGRFQPLGATSAYEIYVIGSTCGGTCSGAFLEMPSLIRKALLGIANSSDRLHIHAILFLPDALPVTLSPGIQQRLQANGYASLKELNYYQGMKMREGYTETFACNGGEITIPNSDGIADGGEFYMIPYLIGSPGGASDEAPASCREAIGEFLVSLLANISTSSDSDPFLTEAFLANALDDSYWSNRPADPANSAKERKDTYHEFPMSFSSIGFAKADVPQELVRAYQVMRVAVDAGISPVDKDKREELERAGVPVDMLPFRKANHFMSSPEAKAAIDGIMKPLEDINNLIYFGVFNAEADLKGVDMSFEGLSRPEIRQAMESKTDILVSQRTDANALESLKQKVQEKYILFKSLVKDFVVKHGPYAFVNLFDGNYTCTAGELPLGIKARLENLVGGKNSNGTVVNYMTVDQTSANLAAAATTLNQVGNGLGSKIIGIFTGKQDDAKNAYLNAFNDAARARIIDVKRSAATGADGYLNQNFLQPAIRLRDDLRSFGDILDVLGNVYSAHGKKMENFNAFKGANVGETSVNMAAISDKSYNWLKEQADQAILNTMGVQFRTRLVEDFFEGGNSTLWLDVPETVAAFDASGKVTMLYDGAAIPARERFDKIAAEIITTPVNVSVNNLFTDLAASGESYATTAKNLIDQLYDRSRPRYRGAPGNATHMYIMYPTELKTGGGDGAAIAAALENYARTQYNVKAYTSDDADGIMFYQQVTGLELYKLTEIAVWEKEYEKKLNEDDNLLHGNSPDTTAVYSGTEVDYQQTLSWADYPALVGRADPERPDPKTGKICREGMFRIELRKLMQEAMELGVIYKEEEDDGWHFYRVHLDRATTSWELDVNRDLAPDSVGMRPLGKELVERVAQKHGRTLDNVEGGLVKPIILAKAGHLSRFYKDEKTAFEYALRCLRANVPMYVEVVKTMELFRKWGAEIRKENEKALAKLRPAKMIWLMRGGILFRDDNKVWKLKNEVGGIEEVLNLSDEEVAYSWDLPAIIDNRLIGYVLYQKVDALLPGNALDAACRRSAEEQNAMKAANDREGMRAAMDLYREIDAERKVMLELGARADAAENTPLSSKFKQEMLNRMNYSDAEAKEVELFYGRLPLATTLNPRHFQN